MKNKPGFALLFVVIMVALALLQISFVAKSYLLMVRQTDLSYKIAKTHYLAVSGLAVAATHGAELPQISEPLTKEAIYASLDQGFIWTAALDGQVYLFISPLYLYSVGVFAHKYRALIRAKYHLEKTLLVIDSWERL